MNAPATTGTLKALRHPRKQKTRPNGAKAALLVSAAIAAGGIASITWIQMSTPRKQSSPAANPPSAGSNSAEIKTNRDTPSMSVWLASQTNAAELLNFGTTLLEEGRVNESILCYRRALELNADDEETHFNLGVAYARAGHLDEAAHHYREALKIVPDYAEAHNNLGNVLTRQKRHAEAMEEFQSALKLSPDNAMAHNNLGRALAEQGNPADALMHFAEAARLDTNYVEARFNLGAAYLTMGRTNDAVAEFKSALQLRPDFAPALQMLSRLRVNAP